MHFESQKYTDLLILPRVDSTNSYAKEHFDSLTDGFIIAARDQYGGRGRLGRKWVTAPDKALTASVVYKNILRPFHAGIITALAGLELLHEHIPDEFIFFKWPNDIYVREYKIAGILSEGILKKNSLAGVVSGIGININQTADEMREIDNPATSLNILAGENYFTEKLYLLLAEKIKKYYIMYQSNPSDVIKLWHGWNLLLGETLVLNFPDGSIKRGVFTSIGEDGEMILRSSSGDFFRFDCGDVKIDTSLIDFGLLKNNNNNKWTAVCCRPQESKEFP